MSLMSGAYGGREAGRAVIDIGVRPDGVKGIQSAEAGAGNGGALRGGAPFGVYPGLEFFNQKAQVVVAFVRG